MLNCNNSIACEKYLINLFKTKFTQKTYYGTEYFEGDKKMMIREIIKYITSVYDKEDAEDKVNNNVESVVGTVVGVVALVSVNGNEKGDRKIKKDKKKVVKNEENVVKEKKESVDNIIIKNNILDKPKYFCPKCKNDFKFECLLKRHLNISSRCKISSEEINNIIDNINKNINNFNKINNINNIIYCNICNSIFTKKSSLIFHKNNSKCGQLQIAKLISNKEGIDKLNIKQLKLLYPDNYKIMLNNIKTQNNI